MIRYWRYRADGLVTCPPAPSVDHADHDPSGVAVFPLLVCTTMVVPAGTSAVNVARPHVAVVPASNTEDVNVPLETYAPYRTQSAWRAGEALNADRPAFSAVPCGSDAEIVVFSTPSTINWNPPLTGCTR